MFRPFKENENGIYIEVNATQRIFIDKEIKTKIEVIEYVKRNIELATEMCKEQPVLFLPHFNQFIPEKLCVQIIIQEDVSPSLRSCLLKFYVASYLSAKCLPIPLKNFPDLLKIREQHFEDKYSKINERLRTKILKEMEVTKQKNLKDYIFSYLQNPENYIRIQPEFLESLLDFLIFLIKRQFFLVKEIADLKYALFNFLKYFLSYSKTEVLSNLTDLMMENRLHKKGSSMFSINKSGIQDKLSDVIHTNNQEDISEKNKSFIMKMISCLKYVEDTIFDLRFEYLAHEKESQEFFDLTDINSKMPQKELNKILTTKLEKREDYMVELSRKIASPPTHYTFTLIDMMTMNDLEISQLALEVLIQLYDVRFQFMKKVPYLQVVQSDNIMDSILLKYLSAYKKIFEAESRINKIRNPEDQASEVAEIFGVINNELSKAISDIVDIFGNEEMVYKRTKGLIDKHYLTDITINGTQEVGIRKA